MSRGENRNHIIRFNPAMFYACPQCEPLEGFIFIVAWVVIQLNPILELSLSNHVYIMCYVIINNG